MPTKATHITKGQRAIGIVRVSQVGGREGDSFASPDEQRDRIQAACERDNLRLLDTIDELDVSGGTPLDRRAGLRRAVEMVESGEADVVVAAYFDRLVRSLRVQDELVSRVEAAGGRVLAVDVGQVTNGSAGQWLSGTMLGAVSEYQRRTTAERSAEAQGAAVRRGAYIGRVPAGYLRGPNGVLMVDSDTAPAVTEAFAMRAAGATVAEVRTFLAGHDIETSYAGAGRLLNKRAYLGESRFGELVNPDAHAALVDVETFRRVQRARVPAGRRAKSDYLLARLDVLRCGSCGRPMSASTGHKGRSRIYRCSSHAGDGCPRPVTVSADLVEQAVIGAVREVLANVDERESAESNVRAAEAALEHAQDDLDAAVRAFAGLADEQSATERLAELQQARDAARDRVDQLGGSRAAIVINAAADWDDLSLAGRRDLIRATVERVTVAPGRGADRVTVELLGE